MNFSFFFLNLKTTVTFIMSLFSSTINSEIKIASYYKMFPHASLRPLDDKHE